MTLMRRTFFNYISLADSELIMHIKERRRERERERGRKTDTKSPNQN